MSALETGMQCSRTDTVVRGRSDTGELSLPAGRGPGRERRANAVGRAVSDSVM